MESPLQHPINCDAPVDTLAPWRDNAFISFWDPAQEVFGTLHVSTGPVAAGRRARVSLCVQGTVTEVIEPLGAATFESDGIAFDLASGSIRVDTETLALSLVATERLPVADFCPGGVIPKMGSTELQHFQAAVTVRGTLDIKGARIDLDAVGVRDRTWGERNESTAIREYVWAFITFPDFALTAMRFHAEGGSDRIDGFLITEAGIERIAGLSVIRDPAGLCAGLQVGAASGESFDLRSGGRRGGFWVPMGPERAGPAMSAYDEFASFTLADGSAGFGLVEHGVVRQLF